MAQDLRRLTTPATVLRLLCAAARRAAPGLLVAAAAGAVHAQTLVDPTRPPAGWLVRATPATDRPLNNVQTVKTSKAGPLALVDGRVVKIGDPFGDSRVIRITDSEVVLQHPGGATEVMRIHPSVEKRPAVQASDTRVGDTPVPMLRAGE
jgi:MSHA biogenesis protein MshK